MVCRVGKRKGTFAQSPSFPKACRPYRIGTLRKHLGSLAYKTELSHRSRYPNLPHRRYQIMASATQQGLDTPQVQFVLRFFDCLSARNLDTAFSLLSDTLVYELWPASLAHAPRTKAEYKALLDTNPDRDVKVPSFQDDRIHAFSVLTRLL